ENDGTTTVSVVNRKAFIVTCDKTFFNNATGSGVNCTNTSIPIGAIPPTNPLQNCFPGQTQPADPVEMNSVLIGKYVKTVTVEKEVLTCPAFPGSNQQAIGELFLVTEIIEEPTTTGTGAPTS